MTPEEEARHGCMGYTILALLVLIFALLFTAPDLKPLVDAQTPTPPVQPR